jgi:DNA integrity scanning protein DisA with diadenylate cyclase activity
VGQYKSVDDSEFERLITLRDAYKVMESFISDYHARGDTSVVDLLTYLHLMENGQSLDPAAIYDFLSAASKVLN